MCVASGDSRTRIGSRFIDISNLSNSRFPAPRTTGAIVMDSSST
jgi:hypothetical protein